MEISKYDIYAYQIMHYLITAYQYQVVRVDQYKEDLWLANPKQEQYPVIRISSQRMEKVDENIAYLRNVHRKILDMIHREGHLLLLNTCPDCFLLDNPFIKQIRVGPHSVSDIMILQTFRNLAEVVHDVEDPKEEMARLARSIEETQILQQKKFIAKVKRSLRPDITITVMAFCVLYALVNYTGMIQKEVAERIAAGPGSKTYGILSVLIQAWYKVEYLFTVHEHVFNPPPKVKSAVICMMRNETHDLGCDEKLFKQVVKTTFNQRRKTLRNSIKPILGKDCPLTEDVLFNKRPEQLSVQEFIQLTNQVEQALRTIND